jgi:tRNA pseudouridine65 synthase
MSDLQILHEDAAIVVVAKPSGLLVHRTPESRDEDALLQLARDATGGDHLYPVHRLDRGASGVLVLARSSEAARRLHEQFEDAGADKRYLALVRGAPAAAGVIDHPLPRRVDGPRVPAVTEYRRLATVTTALVDREGRERAQPYALVEARPRSGRLHQVRRHLKHLGHPLLGDANYGRTELNRWCRERYGLARLALHAAALAFDHPATGARVCFEAALPADLAEPLARMGFDAPMRL